MNLTRTKARTLVATVTLFASIIGGTNAALHITNWNISGNTLTYDISGIIDPGANIGSTNPQRLHIGVPGDTDWVLVNGVVSSAVNHAGATRAVSTVTPRYLNDITVAFGDYTWLNTSDNQAWAVGDILNASVTAVGGTLNGANIEKEHIIVTAGRSEATLNVLQLTNQVGLFVPEPSSVLLLGLGSLVLALRRSRGQAWKA